MNFYKSYLMMLILFACAPFSLFAMQPQGFRLLQRYFQRASAHILRPGQVHVFMNDVKTISLAPDAHNRIILSTAGLIGCTATVLYAKDNAAHQHAILMHYHPDNNEEHLMELEHQMQLLMADGKTFQSMKFLSVLPSDSFWVDQTLHTADCLKKRKALEGMVQKSSRYSQIDMLHTTYDLPPTGKGYCAEVYVTLANNELSKCQVAHWADGYSCTLE